MSFNLLHDEECSTIVHLETIVYTRYLGRHQTKFSCSNINLVVVVEEDKMLAEIERRCESPPFSGEGVGRRLGGEYGNTKERDFTSKKKKGKGLLCKIQNY